jgi:hypothetical protein
MDDILPPPPLRGVCSSSLDGLLWEPGDGAMMPDERLVILLSNIWIQILLIIAAAFIFI